MIKLKFSDSFSVEAQGKLDGLWLLWNKKKIDIEVLYFSKHYIHFIVDDGEGFHGYV